MTVFHVAEIVDALQGVRQQWRDLQRRALEPGGRDLPAREALAEVIEPASIESWLQQPNPAFQGSTPLQLVERGEMDRLWRMLYELGSGQPG